MAQPAASAVAQRMRKLAAEVERANSKAVNQAALQAKRLLVAEVNAVAPGGRLRNVGRSGAKLGVRYDVKGTRNPVAIVRATGPWQFVEGVIKAHDIAPRRRRGRGARALSMPFGARASARHPGVRSRKKPWQRGFTKAKPVVRKVISAAYSDAFKRGIR